MGKYILTVLAFALFSFSAFAGADRVLDGKTITVGGVVLTLPTTTGTICTNDNTQTFENKTISGASNTLTNIDLTASVTGALPIANGGTGQTTAQAAIDALVPSQTGNGGQFLTTDGTNVSWAAPSVTPEFADDVFRIQDNGDASKELAFEVSAITTATTRTITVGDADLDLTIATGDFASRTLNNLGTTALGGVALNGTGQISPNTDGNRFLGTSTFAWQNVYADAFTVNDAGGSYTLPGQDYIIAGSSTSISGVTVEAAIRGFNADDDFGIWSSSTGSTNPSGSLYFETGNNSSSGNSGSIHLETGDSTSGTVGSIILDVDQDTSDGAIVFQDGSQGTSGHVWTSQDANGTGAWAAPAEPAPDITGSRGTPTAITAGGGITAGSGYHQVQFIEGSGGAVDITANPQISAGTNVGEILILVGRNDTNTVTLDDGTGLSLNGTWVGAADSVIHLMWDGTNWLEVSRR